jgi:hypothetical protein
MKTFRLFRCVGCGAVDSAKPCGRSHRNKVERAGLPTTTEGFDVVEIPGGFDAAVVRMAKALYEWRYAEPGQCALDESRTALKAALTPTEEPCSSDGPVGE